MVCGKNAIDQAVNIYAKALWKYSECVRRNWPNCEELGRYVHRLREALERIIEICPEWRDYCEKRIGELCMQYDC